MRKLNHSQTDAVKFMNTVIDSKRAKDDPDYKDRCKAIVSNKNAVIAEYDPAFADNALERLSAHSWTKKESDDFKSLYSYSLSAFKRLRESIINDEHNRRNDLCPLCELDRISTLDHFLPKEHFPAYTIHPKNLVPCCSTCNSHKSHCWHDDGTRKVWNVYLDSLPASSYLKCDITIVDELPNASFRLENTDIDPDTFALITRTFTQLHLIQRYNDASYHEMQKFITTIVREIKITDRYSFDENIKRIKKIVNDGTAPNNWTYTLKMAMLDSPELLSYLCTLLP